MLAIVAHPPQRSASPTRDEASCVARTASDMPRDVAALERAPSAAPTYGELTAGQLADLIEDVTVDPRALLSARRELALSGEQIRRLRQRITIQNGVPQYSAQRWRAATLPAGAESQYELCGRMKPSPMALWSDEDQRAYVRDCDRRDSVVHQAAFASQLRLKRRSDVAGQYLEACVADDLRPQVSAFNRVITRIEESGPRPTGEPGPYSRIVGEIDVETPATLFEITVSGTLAGKLTQTRKLRDDRTINPTGKPVVLCAPNAETHRIPRFNQQNVLVARTRAELEELQRRLAFDETGLRPENTGGLLQAISRLIPEAPTRERLRDVLATAKALARAPRRFIRGAGGELVLAGVARPLAPRDGAAESETRRGAPPDRP